MVEYLIECDIALAAVQIMWLLEYELMGGVLALLVFAWLYVQYEDARGYFIHMGKRGHLHYGE